MTDSNKPKKRDANQRGGSDPVSPGADQSGKSGAENHPAASPAQPKTATGGAGRRRGRKTWLQTHGKDLKFLAIFGLLMGLYYVGSTTERMEEQFFPWYLKTNANAAGGFVQLFGYEDMTIRDKSLIDPRGAISVERGCDAMESTALFVSAVLASPAAFTSRLTAAVVGTLLLALINLIRIITLFMTNIHWKKAFDVMHLDVWQAAFILIAIVMWAFWASWETRRRKRRAHAPA